jgi:hypothetical protein
LATELLDDIASLLEGEVLSAVSGPLQHRVRVAANLARIVQRELELGPAGAAAERQRLGALVGDTNGDLAELRARLAARLRDPAPLTADEQHAIYDALVATVRADLAISKPGYDSLETDA